eukprot:gene2264-4404_t
MSRKSRRKTLSHVDLECFLSDIQDMEEGSQQPNKPVILMGDAQINVESVQREPSDIGLIRDFCRMIYTKGLNDPIVYNNITVEMKTIAEQISKESCYMILPSRIITPSVFKHPPSSLDGKKELLHSLSPMLIEAEKVRKTDADECEKFTRCKYRSGKGRDRSVYEYIDIDTNIAVDACEFER